jgi:hypothetical protein
MSDSRKPPPDFDGGLYIANRNKFPIEELAKHAGKYVAWSLDGTRILADGDDEDEVDQKLIAAGIDPGQVVGSYVWPLDGTSLL